MSAPRLHHHHHHHHHHRDDAGDDDDDDDVMMVMVMTPGMISEELGVLHSCLAQLPTKLCCRL